MSGRGISTPTGGEKSAAIMQPHLLPFAGYFDLLRRADVLLFYDTAQFRRRSWHNRTWIRQGDHASMLTAPVRLTRGSRCAIAQVQLDDDQPWRQRSLRRLEYAYGPVPTGLRDVFERGPRGLADWNIAGIEWIAGQVGLSTHMVRASALAPPTGIDATAKLVWMCERLGATRYLATPGARGYLQEAPFESAGIGVEWLSYDYGHWLRDPGGQGVFPSLLDLLLIAGPDRARLEVGRPTTTIETTARADAEKELECAP